MDLDAHNPAVHHYNDGNRAFLQAIMARGTLTLKEGKSILAAIFTAQEGLLNLPDRRTCAYEPSQAAKPFPRM